MLKVLRAARVGEGENPMRLRKGNPRWLTACDCGRLKFIYGSQLTKKEGGTKSCGCEQHTGSRIEDGLAAKHAAFSHFRSHVVSRRSGKMKCKLTFNEFVFLSQQPCYYCGRAWTTEKEIAKSSGVFRYNGIDRVDSKLDYSVGNCVACCKFCNFAKNAMTQEEFAAHIVEMHEHYILGKKPRRTGR